MEKKHLSTQMHRGFQLDEIQITSETDQVESVQIQWKITRIEGGLRSHRHDHGIAATEDLARQRIDEILDTTKSTPEKPT